MQVQWSLHFKTTHTARKCLKLKAFLTSSDICVKKIKKCISLMGGLKIEGI